MPVAEVGQRVQVDISGLKVPGVEIGDGVSSSGTITGVDAAQGLITVRLDAVFNGLDTVTVPVSRVTAIQ